MTERSRCRSSPCAGCFPHVLVERDMAPWTMETSTMSGPYGHVGFCHPGCFHGRLVRRISGIDPVGGWAKNPRMHKESRALGAAISFGLCGRCERHARYGDEHLGRPG